MSVKEKEKRTANKVVDGLAVASDIMYVLSNEVFKCDKHDRWVGGSVNNSNPIHAIYRHNCIF